MDKQTAIIKHRAMWQWLSENPAEGTESAKIKYTKIFGYGRTIKANCFLCQYNEDNYGGDCSKCLLVWPLNDQEDPNCTTGGLWDQWDDTTTFTGRADLARQIRDLPEREEEGRFTGFAGMELHHATTGRITSRDEETQRRLQEGREHWRPVEPKTPPPPPKLTRSDAIAKTREQWKWLAEHPNKGKLEYFESVGIEYPFPFMSCYLCEYIRTNDGETVLPGLEDVQPSTCGILCPFNWPGGVCMCEDNIGLYDLWLYTTDPALRTSVALTISLLPEKEE